MYTDLRQDFPRPDPITVEGFRGIWAATLADTMGRHGIMFPDIRPIFEGIQLVGVAAMVLNYPNDNITTHQALTMLQPGDVLVLDEGDGNVTGSFGHNMSLQAPNVYHPTYARAAHVERLTEVASVDRGSFGSRSRTTETGRNLPSTASNNERRLIAVRYSERAIPVSASSG